MEGGVAETVKTFVRLDVAVSNAGIQHIAPLTELKLEDWRRVTSIDLDGGFLLTPGGDAPLGLAGAGRAEDCSVHGGVHSLEASPLKAPTSRPSTGCSDWPGPPPRRQAGRPHQHFRPGFVRTPLVERQIPEQARELGISEAEVVKNVMLRNTVDGEFTTLEDIAQLAVFLAAFPSAALTGQVVVPSHGWHMH